MTELAPPQSHYLNAAIGWLELGNAGEAAQELDRIADVYLDSPAVLEVRWRVEAAKNDWPAALQVAYRFIEAHPEDPVAWINQAYSLHEMKRTQEAWDRLFPAIKKFPAVAIIPYNLACYACQLSRTQSAMELLTHAISLKSKSEIKKMALSDLDLKPLWDMIRKL